VSTGTAVRTFRPSFHRRPIPLIRLITRREARFPERVTTVTVGGKKKVVDRGGKVTLFLVAVLGVAACLVLGHLGLGRASSLATLAGLPVSLVATAASVLSLRYGTGGNPTNLDQIADELAKGLRRQWEAEAKIRELDGPTNFRWPGMTPEITTCSTRRPTQPGR
jgi:hypothetical protein